MQNNFSLNVFPLRGAAFQLIIYIRYAQCYSLNRKKRGRYPTELSLTVQIRNTPTFIPVFIWINVCVCVEIILTIPIHTCHASIWILLSDHMSVPSNRIQAQMRSSEVQLTCHRSDSPHQVIALRRTAFLMELTDTRRGRGGAGGRGVGTGASPVSRYM